MKKSTKKTTKKAKKSNVGRKPKPASKRIRCFSVGLPDGTLTNFIAEAERREMSASYLARRIISAWLKKTKEKPSRR
ncbi:MAG: hypothetical protein LBK06_08435 [Planctomycetaceae bacterium]|jgi:hypothetical protein|nr:hypothetical protein [Planctomycetaceae bacterium]